uniref:Putative lipoprotein n=1 Tax=Rhizobium rhizogenes TaxID=359 RepID=A0A7S4ZS80_RHIRH|nr:hypothetical protein [Rhizobium rhizogenes]QCL09133.1 putative lipoprotein [Rhizobium rhizogenes]QCL09516.1 putative lipoprotein [Rhizobium rhizogenes]
MRNKWYLLAASLLCGCAQLPDTTHVSNFGNAVQNGALALNTVADENVKLALISDQADETLAYISGYAKFAVLDRPKNVINPREFDFRRVQLKALAEYGAALKNAADGKKTDALKDAAVKLATAVGTVASDAVPGSAVVITPVATIIGKGVGASITSNYAKNIYAIVHNTDPYVQVVVVQLKRDFKTINNNTSRLLDSYEKDQKSILLVLRQRTITDDKKDGADDKKVVIDIPKQPIADPRADAPEPSGHDKYVWRDGDNRAPMYHAMMEANQAVVAERAAVEAASRASGVLDEIAKAHHVLATEGKDAKLEMNDILSHVDDLTALIAAAKK